MTELNRRGNPEEIARTEESDTEIEPIAEDGELPLLYDPKKPEQLRLFQRQPAYSL